MHELLVYFGDESFVSCFICSDIHSEYCLFILFNVSFAVLDLICLFCFYFHYSRRLVKEDLAEIFIKEFSVFSSTSFIVSGLTIRSLIHFEFIFVYGVRKCSNFILLHAVQFFQHHLLKRPSSFLHCIFLPPFSKIRCP